MFVELRPNALSEVSARGMILAWGALLLSSFVSIPSGLTSTLPSSLVSMSMVAGRLHTRFL